MYLRIGLCGGVCACSNEPLFHNARNLTSREIFGFSRTAMSMPMSVMCRQY